MGLLIYLCQTNHAFCNRQCQKAMPSSTNTTTTTTAPLLANCYWCCYFAGATTTASGYICSAQQHARLHVAWRRPGQLVVRRSRHVGSHHSCQVHAQMRRVHRSAELFEARHKLAILAIVHMNKSVLHLRVHASTRNTTTNCTKPLTSGRGQTVFPVEQKAGWHGAGHRSRCVECRRN